MTGNSRHFGGEKVISQQREIVIVGGGRRPDFERLKKRCSLADVVIAADSGADWLQKIGVVPDVLIGDYDSILPDNLEKIKNNGLTRWVQHKTDKDQTDMELCVDEALRLGAEKVRIFGGFGTRMDHTVANINLLYCLHEAGVEAWLEDESNRVTLLGRLDSHTNSIAEISGSKKAPGFVAALCKAVEPSIYSDEISHGMYIKGFTISIQNEAGFKISLIAFPPGARSVTTSGLRFDMRGRDLPFVSTLAVSNEFSDSEAWISLKSGLIMVMLSKD